MSTVTFPSIPDEGIVQYFIEKTDKKDVPVNIAILKAPSRDSVMVIFNFFMKEIMGFNMDAALVLPFDNEPIVHMEMYQDRIPFLRFFGCMRQFLAKCHYPNFSIEDLHNPKPKRFRRQLSALINYSLFCEKQDDEFGDEVMRHCLLERDECDRLEKENAELKVKLLEDVKKIDQTKITIAQEEARLAQHNAELESLKEVCEQLPKDLRQSKADAAKLSDEIQSDIICETQVLEEIGLLEGQLVTSPDKQRQMLLDAEAKLKQAESERETNMARLSDLATMRQNMEQLATDVDRFSGSVDTFLDDRKQMDEVQKKTSANQSELDKLGCESQRQLDNLNVLENKIRLREEGIETDLLKAHEFISAVESELEQRKEVLQQHQLRSTRCTEDLQLLDSSLSELKDQRNQLQKQYDEQLQYQQQEGACLDSQVESLTVEFNNNLANVLSLLNVSVSN